MRPGGQLVSGEDAGGRFKAAVLDHADQCFLVGQVFEAGGLAREIEGTELADELVQFPRRPGQVKVERQRQHLRDTA